MVAIAVPLNTIFGVACALLLVRHRWKGNPADRRDHQPALRDLPGRDRALAVPALRHRRLVRPDADRRRDRGPLLDRRGWSWPASSSRCRSSSARRCRCCRRSAPSRSRPPRRSAPTPGRPSGGSPCRRSAGESPTASSSTTARVLGEFGAVSVVSGKISGQTETLPLFVSQQFEQFNLAGRLRRPRSCSHCSPSRPVADEPAERKEDA